MNRTRDWRRSKTRTHKETDFKQRLARQSDVWGTETREEFVEEYHNSVRRGIPVWFGVSVRHGNGKCDYCLGGKILKSKGEPIDNDLKAWYDEDINLDKHGKHADSRCRHKKKFY